MFGLNANLGKSLAEPGSRVDLILDHAVLWLVDRRTVVNVACTVTKRRIISPAKELFAVVCVFSKLIEGRACSVRWFPQEATSYCFQTAQELQGGGSQ